MNKTIVLKEERISSCFLLVLLAAFLIRLFLIFTPGHVDIKNHIDWGIRFWQYGPRDFYEQIFWGVSWPNQPFGSIFLYALIARLYDYLRGLIWWLNISFPLFPSFFAVFAEQSLHSVLLKIPFLLTDLALGSLLFNFIRRMGGSPKVALLSAGFFLLNPALIYNSAVWGQTDSLVNLMALAGIWLVFRNRFWAGIFLFASSFLFKLSVSVFLPVMFLLLWDKRRFWPAILTGFFITGLFITLVTLPFVHHGHVFSWLWYLYENRVLPRQGDMLSANAFNFWTMIYGIDLSLKEKMLLGPFPAMVWGRLAAIIIIFGIAFWQRKIKRKFDFSDYAFLATISAFAAFLFLTNMHERYLYPVFPFLIIVWGLVRRETIFRIIIILSFIYWINMYNLWWQPDLPWVKMILTAHSFFVPRVLSVLNLLVFVLMVKEAIDGQGKT